MTNQTIEDIRLLWDHYTEKGISFLTPSAVPAMRAILDGVPLESLKGYEWVKEARESKS